MIQNNLRLSFQSARMEVVLFGSHWGHHRLYRKDAECPQSLQEMWQWLATGRPAVTWCTRACTRTCVLVDSTNLGCFVKGLWQSGAHCAHLPGNQTPAQQQWKTERSLNLPGCLYEAQSCRGTNTAHPYSPGPWDVPSFTSSTTRDYRQQWGLHKDKPHRAQLPDAWVPRRHHYSLPFAVNVSPAASPSSSHLCAFFHFSLEIPPVQDVFYFTLEKSQGCLHGATEPALSAPAPAQRCSFLPRGLPKPCVKSKG